MEPAAPSADKTKRDARAQLVLIAEDEFKLAAVLADYLTAAGYDSLHESDGDNVVPAAVCAKPDLILLDLMLPNRDGIDICRDLRTFTNTPVIMVTARVEEVDRLLGLDVGADDYICKPFSPREVVARVRTILRRVGTGSPNEAQSFTFDVPGQRIHLNGQWLELTTVEFRLLRLLASAPGNIFSREALLRRIYTDNRQVTTRTVDSHVKNLRRKLEQADPAQTLVRSVYGSGYKLEY